MVVHEGSILPQFIRVSTTSSAALRSGYQRGSARATTRLDPIAPAYRDLIVAAMSIAGPSVKLQWPAGFVLDVCLYQEKI